MRPCGDQKVEWLSTDWRIRDLTPELLQTACPSELILDPELLCVWTGELWQTKQIQFMIIGLSWSTEDGNKVKFCSPFHRSHVYVPSKGMQLYIITFGSLLTPPHSSQPFKTGVKLECLLHLPVSPLCPWFVCSGYEDICNSFYCMLYIHNLRTGKRSQTLLPLCTVGGNAPSSTRLWCATLLTSATLYSSNTSELLNLIERKSH